MESRALAEEAEGCHTLPADVQNMPDSEILLLAGLSFSIYRWWERADGSWKGPHPQAVVWRVFGYRTASPIPIHCRCWPEQTWSLEKAGVASSGDAEFSRAPRPSPAGWGWPGKLVSLGSMERVGHLEASPLAQVAKAEPGAGEGQTQRERVLSAASQ